MELERRDFSFDDVPEAELQVETRADGRPVIRGYAIVYNRLSVDLGGFRERIMPGAFDGFLGRQRGRGDLVSYYNHNPDILLGRESSGTLKVWSDDKGVVFEVSPPTSRADIVELIQRRDVKGSSFAFTVDKGGERFTNDENGRAIREITNGTMYELGPVVNPAYPSTSAAVAMRSYEAWLASQAQAESVAEPEAVVVAKRSLVRDAAVAAALRLRNV